MQQNSDVAEFPSTTWRPARAEQRDRMLSSREARLKPAIEFLKSTSAENPVVSQAQWKSLISRHLAEPSIESQSEILMLLQPRELGAEVAEAIGAANLAKMEDFSVFSTRPMGVEKRLSIQAPSWRRHQESIQNFLAVVTDAETRSALLASIGGLDEMVWAGTRDLVEIRAFVRPEWDRISIRLHLIEASGDVIPAKNLSFTVIPDAPLPVLEGEISLPKSFERLSRDEFSYWRVGFRKEPSEDEPWDAELELRQALEKQLNIRIAPLSDRLGAVLVELLHGRRLDASELRPWLVRHGYAVELQSRSGTMWLIDTLPPDMSRSSGSYISRAEASPSPDPLNREVMLGHQAAGFPGVPPLWMYARVATGESPLGRINLPVIPLRALLGTLDSEEWNSLSSPDGCALYTLSPKQQALLVQIFEDYPFFEVAERQHVPLAKQIPRAGSIWIRSSLGDQVMVRSGTEELGPVESAGNVLAQMERDPSELPLESARIQLPRYEIRLGNGRRWVWTAAADLSQELRWGPSSPEVRGKILEEYEKEKERMTKRRELFRQVIRP